MTAHDLYCAVGETLLLALTGVALVVVPLVMWAIAHGLLDALRKRRAQRRTMEP